MDASYARHPHHHQQQQQQAHWIPHTQSLPPPLLPPSQQQQQPLPSHAYTQPPPPQRSEFAPQPPQFSSAPSSSYTHYNYGSAPPNGIPPQSQSRRLNMNLNVSIPNSSSSLVPGSGLSPLSAASSHVSHPHHRPHTQESAGTPISPYYSAGSNGASYADLQNAPPSLRRKRSLPFEEREAASRAGTPTLAYENDDGSGEDRGRSVGAGAAAAAQNNFVSKLYAMITDPKAAQYITWTELGTSFVVSSVGEFSRSVLGGHFKHNNFSSFVRQLNMYGFHKINRTPRAQRTSSDLQTWEFSHPKFLRGRPDLLDAIRRKALEPDPSLKQRVELPGEVAAQLRTMRTENSQMATQLAAERRKVERLVGVVGRLWDIVSKGFGPNSVPPFPSDLLENDTVESPNIYVTEPPEHPPQSPSPYSHQHPQQVYSVTPSPTTPDFPYAGGWRTPSDNWDAERAGGPKRQRVSEGEYRSPPTPLSASSNAPFDTSFHPSSANSSFTSTSSSSYAPQPQNMLMSHGAGQPISPMSAPPSSGSSSPEEEEQMERRRHGRARSMSHGGGGVGVGGGGILLPGPPPAMDMVR